MTNHTDTTAVTTEDQHTIQGMGDEDEVIIPSKERVPLWKILAMTLSLCGVQFQWSTAFSIVTPFFSSKGLDEHNSSGVWVFGPVVGIIVGPLVGTFSDECTAKIGKRRPFIIVGSAFLTLSLLIFGWSEKLGQLFGDTDTDESKTIIIAIVAFAVMNIAINVLQGPCRVIVADLLPSEQQNLGQSCATGMQAVGQIAGGLVTYFGGGSGQAQIIMTVGACLNVLTVLMTCFFAKETRQKKRAGEGNAFIKVCKNIWRGLVHMPPFLRRVCVVQVFAWFAWFCILPNATQWMGSTVYGGDAQGTQAQKDLFKEGETFANLAVVFQACLQVAASLLVPFLVEKVGIRLVYFSSMLVFAGTLFGAAWIRDKSLNILANTMLALLGIAFATTNIFPYSIIALFVSDPSQQGLFMGAMNIFISLPQVIDTQVTGEIAGKFSADGVSGWWVVLFIGSGFALLAAVSTLFLKLSKDPLPRDEEVEPLISTA